MVNCSTIGFTNRSADHQELSFHQVPSEKIAFRIVFEAFQRKFQTFYYTPSEYLFGTDNNMELSILRLRRSAQIIKYSW